MLVRVKNIKREIQLITVPDNATVKDLREAIAKVNQVDYQRIKIIIQAKQLNIDTVELSNTPIKDANIDLNNFCMYLIGQPGQISKPAPVTTPTTTPISTPISTPIISTSITIPAQVPVNQESQEDSENLEEEVGDMNNFADVLNNANLDFNKLLEAPDIIQAVMQFRLQDPVYQQAYSLFPEETKLLLANKAFLMVSISDMGRAFANNTNGGVPKQITIKWLSDETDEKKEIFKNVVDMGYNPVDTIQALRACAWDVGAAIDLLITMKLDDIEDAEKPQTQNQ